MVIARALVMLLLLDGCVYTKGNLGQTKAGYKNYPTSIEAEHERRKKRRRHALIAAPLEIIGGLALAALALYADSKPSDGETVTERLGDAAEDALGRLIVASIGTALVASGVGDGVLGLIDPVFPSPLIREGRLVPAAEIDSIAPLRGPRFGFHTGNSIGTKRLAVDAGVGFAHWITPKVRLRHSASAELGLVFDSSDRRLTVSGETLLERASTREGAGLYPRRSFGVYAGGGWAAIEDGEDHPVVRGGLAFGTRWLSYRLGTSYTRGDRVPGFELGLRTELRVD